MNSMNVLVIYDTYFGNTAQVAEVIGKSLGDDVNVIKVNEVNMENISGLDLLIMGSPTRAFRPSDDMKKFLDSIPNGTLSGTKVAAFDTRMDPKDVGNPILKFMAGMFGYAANPIANNLVKKGGMLIGEPTGFVVVDREGPLRAGELEKASSWAKSLLTL
jgi:flavodoxin